MGVIWFKVWHDIWGNKGRSLLVIFSMAAGIFAVGSIFGMVDQLQTGMDTAHRNISPSHINLILRDYIPQSIVDDLESVSGVDDIEPVNQITVRYKVNSSADWELGTLVERPDYIDQMYDVQTLVEGDWPSVSDLAVERMTAQYYEIGIGDEVIIDQGGAQNSYALIGVIRHPFVQPPPFGGQAHFFTDAKGLSKFGIPEGYFGQLLVQVDSYSLEEAQRVAGEIRNRLADQGIGVVVTLYQDPDAHWGRMFVEGVTLVIKVMAIVSLLLSVVIVFNTMTAIITQQTDQIGVIKAIGGGRRSIIKIYLFEVLTFSLIAILIATPLSLVFAFYMSSNFLSLFNIDYTTFQFSTRALIIQILAGLLIPVLAALWPVLKGAMITVREAISSYGIGADFGFGKFDRFVDRVGTKFLPTIYAASLGNMFRRKGRLILTLMVLIIAGVMFLVTMSLVSSIDYTLDNETARQKYDMRIGLFGNQQASEISALLDDVPEVTGSQVWLSRNATILREGERLEDSAGLGAQLIGIPAGKALYEPLILDGRWLEDGDTDVIVINQETATKNDIRIGDTVTLDLGDLGDGSWKVVGTYQTVYGTGFNVEPIYAPIARMRVLTGVGDQANQLLLTARVGNLSDEAQLIDEVVNLFENAGIPVDFYTTTAKLEERDFADNQFSTVITMLINLSMLIAIVGGVGLMGSLGISIVERRREIGVMRAIGAGSGSIRGNMIMEGVLQGLFSFVIAVPLAYLLAQPLARVLGQTMLDIDLDFAFNSFAVLIWLAVVLVIAIFASLLPARTATRISVRDSLAYG